MTEVQLEQFPPAAGDVLRTAARLAGGGPAYVVGGALRDLLLGRAIDDLDLAVAGEPEALAHGIAREIGGRAFTLDAERGTVRTVIADPRGALQVDVAAFRAPTIEGDLRGRDFTIDALAVALEPLAQRGHGPLLDVTGGMDDLRRRRLRLAAADAIADDPLRALRGIRLEGELGFRLTADAGRAIRTSAPRLATVAAERIRDELAAILKLSRSASALRRADRLGVLGRVLPEIEPMRDVSQPAPHRFDVLEHSLRAVEAADRLVASLDRLVPFGDALTAHLAEPQGGGFSRRETLKLAALLHDVSKPQTRRVIEERVRFFGHDIEGAARVRVVASRLRLPNEVGHTLETLVRHHLRLMHLAQAGEVTRRARHRFFQELGDDARDVLLLSLVDAAGLTGGSPLIVWRRSPLIRELMEGWREEVVAAAELPLLRGEDVMAAFGLSPGPDVGRLLARAREAQALGLIRTRDEAIGYLRSADEG
jgi:putative nucleotidyltransferase with HDIG domain